MIQPVTSHSTLLRRRRIVWLALTLTIALDTIVQLCWKFAAEQKWPHPFEQQPEFLKWTLC